MSKKKEYIQQGTCRLNRLETIKEFMIGSMMMGTLVVGNRPKDDAKEAYARAVACWEVLCKEEIDDLQAALEQQ